jgi:hypothetical protein
MRLLTDAFAPLALGAAVAFAVSACAATSSTTSPVSPASPTSPTSPSTPLSLATPSPKTTSARPASEKVPATAHAVTISMDPGLNQSGTSNRGSAASPKPVTITDPARVSALTALINDLKLFPPGTYSCPADFGGNLVLTFRASAGAPALAVATVDVSGCDGVDLTIDGKTQPALAGPGTDSAPRVLKAAGLSWKLPTA